MNTLIPNLSEDSTVSKPLRILNTSGWNPGLLFEFSYYLTYYSTGTLYEVYLVLILLNHQNSLNLINKQKGNILDLLKFLKCK